MITLAAVLVLVPGLVTTALGMLLLVPPIRTVAGPGLAAMAVRGVQRRIPLITDRVGSPERAGHGDYIDGEVIDVIDVEPPALPEPRG
jgi:UPF0716 protein FxsA